MNISLEQLDTLAQGNAKPTLIDVRSPGEFAAGHIPGAVNIPMDQIESRLADLGETSVVLVCQSGQRAGITCELIQDRHPDLKVLDGGTNAWVQANRPVVSSTQTRWSLDRQVRLGAGVLVLTGVSLGFAVHPGWFGLAAFVGAGLTFAGLTDICGMAFILAKMPWNKPARSDKFNQKVQQS
ncbi:MAG: rhodanese-like domain-containing protein [Armatimonadetes bacterium]|nr:rhodanese-like domain-containing protein [Armatimonadota bacterium]MBS1710413.1 rhodanese-like domain-containing protein [Armatimonadota bacterium]MBX3108949.1 rhodanese-like domain-containing protein [Fimbriimonadaceae bacterium]